MQDSTIIILASARKKSDTLQVVERIFHQRNMHCIDLLDQQIAPYNYEKKYPAEDNFQEIITQCITFQKIIFATPVYWYSMSGMLKNFFDRLTDIVTINKELGRKLAGKSIGFIAVGADPEIPPGFETPFTSIAHYFDMQFIGSIYYCTKNERIKDLNIQKLSEFLKRVEIG
ncbi:MAG: NAD(P)H-dependent oxidoreductase [Bacteroidetes bacterium]|nr:NAD(P)H-dependent oxidoreductase [Bacteroidota bacterium]